MKICRCLSLLAALGLLAAAPRRAAAQTYVDGGQTLNISSDTTFSGLVVGNTSTGTVNQTGGTVNVTSSQFTLGNSTGAVGYYNFSGGTINFNTTGYQFNIGSSGQGIFVQTGNSTLNVATFNLQTGTNSSYSLATGGALNITSLFSVKLGNTYTQTGGTATLGTGTTSGTFRVYGGSAMNLSGGTFTATSTNTTVGVGNLLGWYAGTGAGTLNLSGTGAIAFTGTTLTMGLGEAGVINQSGTSTLTAAKGITLGTRVTLSNGTTYAGSGTINLNGGTLSTTSISLGAAATVGTTTYAPGTGTLNLNGGTLQASGASTNFLNVTTANVRNGGAVLDTGANAVAISQALVHSTISGDNAADGGLIKRGSGTLTLSGANTYTGATTVNAGTLQAGVASVPGVSGAFGRNSAVSLGNVAGATLNLNSFNTQIGSLTGGGTAGGNVTLGTATLTVGGDNTSPAAYAGAISGTGGLTKIGTGTQTLSGANTYSGPTAVNAGTLAVNGSLAGSGMLSVNNLATLMGTGTVAGPVAVAAGGTFAPGQSGVGQLTMGSSLTLTGTATAAFTLGGTMAGTGYTQALVAGQVNLGTAATLSLSLANGFTPVVGTKFYLLDETGTQTAVLGDFANAPLNGSQFTQNGVVYQINYLDHDPADTSNALFNDVSVTVLPEPSTWATVTIGAGLLGLVLRRRRAV